MSDSSYAPDRSQLYHIRLVKILGQGGTGIVYQGIDTKKGDAVAVKLFRENFFRNRLHLMDLIQNVKKFKKLKHQNLVQIFDFIDGDEGRCMLMEFVDGPNLRWYLANRPWNLQERVNIIIQICIGLQYLHDNGFVHHDFKPANVLFTRRGIVKIADYSLFGNNFILELLDRNISQQITPMFVAPEVIRGERVTPKSDLYSLGITMYMMFTEKLPFPVDNLQQLYYCHLNLMPEHPTTVNPKCPFALGNVIMKLLSKKPENRYRDCDELRIALSNVTQSRI